jgi:uncharacterized membrane protein YfcA
MDFFSGGNDLGTLGLGLVIAGAAAGLFSGVLGRGAGLILVSALFLAARSAGLRPDTAMHLAVGTSFLCLVPLTLARAAATASVFDRTQDRRLFAPLLLGIALAVGAMQARPHGTWLVYLFAATTLVATVLTLTVKEREAGAGPHRIGGGVLALCCAFVPSLIGLSGATLTTPALIAAGTPRDKAAAMATIFAIPITLFGALTAVVSGWNAPGLPQFSYGYVNLLAFVVVVPVAFAANLVAAHYADLLDAKKLRWLFAAFVVFSAGRMVWSVAG